MEQRIEVADSLIGYSIAQWGGFRVAPHHEKIAAALERVARGECLRLMIFMPPRHGKSLLSSQNFPAWYLGKYPDRYIIASTYSQDLASDFGRKVRNQMLDPLHAAIFGGCELSEDSRSVERLATKQGGAYYAVGVGGAITGRGAHVLLIDDPLKGREDADSATVREKIRDWYRSVAYTRLMPGGAVVIIMTRWNIDDLAGWLLKEHSDEGWEVISMPATDEDFSYALWPEDFPVETLKRIRRAIGPREWSALYMQTPVAAGGGDFKRDWVQYYKNVRGGAGMNRYVIVDPANQKKKNSDYTAVMVVGLAADGNYYVLDMYRDRMSLTQRGGLVMELHRKYKPRGVGYEEYGLQADIEYIKTLQEADNYRFPIIALGGNIKKEDRIRRLIPVFERREMYLPETLYRSDHTGKMDDLVRAFIEEEYLPFDAGAHDDMIDCLSRIVDETLGAKFPKEGVVEDAGKRESAYGSYRHEHGMWMI